MPTQKDLKRRVRARMKKTGESYTAARARLLEQRPARRTGSPRPTAVPAPKAGAGPGGPGISDVAVSTKTGRGWREWVEVLDAFGAATRPHAESARHLRVDHGLPSWWAQMVTVGYERIRGLREHGQRRGGGYRVTKSKTYPVPVTVLWTAFGRCKTWLGDSGIRMSKATRPKSMRMRWSDGTPIEVGFFAKGADRSQVQLSHEGFPSRADADRMRAYWTEKLVRLGEVLRG